MKKISDIRTDYTKLSIDEFGLKANPLDQFIEWFDHAVSTNISEVNAMVLSTVSTKGIPRRSKPNFLTEPSSHKFLAASSSKQID